MKPGYEYYRADSEIDFCRLLQEHPGAKILAGATDLIPQARRRGGFDGVIVDPGNCREPNAGIAEEGDTIRIGAFTTFGQLITDPLINRYFPLLAEASRWVGSRQIRNMATLGGNIANASPAGDSMPPLLVYDARLRCRNAGGEREIPLADFYLGYKSTALAPGEFIAAVLMPRPACPAYEYYRKAGPRRVLSISRTAVAARANPDWRIAAAGVAPVPVRLGHVELFLNRRPAGHGASERAGMDAALSEDIAPITDIRGSADYKYRVTLNLLEEMLENYPVSRP